ncbi:hypothetical protein LOTGIDRAFT_237462 [Lottia gigantea]|uniref:Prolyl 4-hydroxylase alpha subunit domain-containing protein n=1 Tax=Lottia gigantea TaxID=225164 RepID=V4AJ21_LOTGI|nr:hypothetical protein LOTGIDRAFT_237462 [Lottia gigantea]ESP04149.1 hypothetical protein LOTGIDRAFT_237462 [Lottia gigantea]
MDKSRIIKRDVELPTDARGKLAFGLYNVFTPKECKDFIKITEKRGYEEALVNIGAGRQLLMTNVRNSDRCIVDSHEDAEKIWQRIRDFIPSQWNERPVLGLNERLRFLRYDGGGYFKPHYDGSYIRENGEKSYITIQLYLNEATTCWIIKVVLLWHQGFDGGSTTFISAMNEKERVEFVPQTGSILVFQHDILHEGSELIKGRKYTMRTDVMFDNKKVGQPLTSA